jgi:cobalt-precorrin-5B (C1)-methyltransferase
LADVIAAKARGTANETLRGAEIAVEVLVVDRQGRLIGQSG